jgi:hypothetical protein
MKHSLAQWKTFKGMPGALEANWGFFVDFLTAPPLK